MSARIMFDSKLLKLHIKEEPIHAIQNKQQQQQQHDHPSHFWLDDSKTCVKNIAEKNHNNSFL